MGELLSKVLQSMRQPRFIFTACMIAALLLSGCAKTRSDASLKQIQQKLEEMAQQREDDQQDIQEMDSRLFLLEDKVDTLRVKQETKSTPKHHPVIRIRPGKSETRADDELVEKPSRPTIIEAKGTGESLVENTTVEYEGEASKGGPRPVLRLYGSSPGSVGSAVTSPAPRSRPAPSIPAAGLSSERLGVVPLPRGTAAARAADPSPARPAAAPAAAARPAPPARDIVKVYLEGLRQYKAGNYTGAIATFTGFVARHPSHQYADNAYYWLGECHYDQREYRKALGHFRQVVTRYPSGNKVPDSMLKMAYCQLKLEDRQAAAKVLSQVVARYPDSRVGKLAAAALKKLQ